MKCEHCGRTWPLPTVENVGNEIMLSILCKLLAVPDNGDQHYVDLDVGVFDCRIDLTDEETDVLRRLKHLRAPAGERVVGPPLRPVEDVPLPCPCPCHEVVQPGLVPCPECGER